MPLGSLGTTTDFVFFLKTSKNLQKIIFATSDYGPPGFLELRPCLNFEYLYGNKIQSDFLNLPGGQKKANTFHSNNVSSKHLSIRLSHFISIFSLLSKLRRHPLNAAARANQVSYLIEVRCSSPHPD